MTARKSGGAINTFVTSYVNWAGSFICYPASKLSGGSGGAKKEGTPRQSTSESLLTGYLCMCGHSVS